MQIRLARLLLKFLVVIGSMTVVVFAGAQELIVFDGKSWTVPHVYVGDQHGMLMSNWPYYSDGRLILVPGGQIQADQAGAVFWRAQYGGGKITITIDGYFTNSFGPADGYVFYLFLVPTSWDVSVNFNRSLPYTRFQGGGPILPQSSRPYLVVWWDPFFTYCHCGSNPIPGEWVVEVAYNPSGSNVTVSPSPSPTWGSPYYGWIAVGSSKFRPSDGQRLRVMLEYDSAANKLSGVATNLDTGETATFSLDLDNYFTPPQPGTYVFGVGSWTGFDYADWSVTYIQQSYTPSLTTFTVTTSTTATTPMTTVTTTVTIPVTRTSTVTATTTVLSTVTSTITAAIATTTATTITALGGIGVVCWILAAVLAVLLAVVILLWRRSSRTIAIGSMETQVR